MEIVRVFDGCHLKAVNGNRYGPSQSLITMYMKMYMAFLYYFADIRKRKGRDGRIAFHRIFVSGGIVIDAQKPDTAAVFLKVKRDLCVLQSLFYFQKERNAAVYGMDQKPLFDACPKMHDNIILQTRVFYDFLRQGKKFRRFFIR